LASIWKVHAHGEEEEGHETHDDSEELEQAVDGHETHNDHEAHDDEAAHHEEHDDAHENEEGHEDHEDHEGEPKEVTSLLIKFRNPMGIVTLPRIINENTTMQAALPKYEVDRLFGLLGVGVQTIAFIALAIMLVSGLSIFISLYKALKERKYELALMRTYGATARQLVWVVLLEGVFLGGIGFFIGWLFSKIGLWFFSSYTEANYGYSLMLENITIGEVWLFVASIGIAIVATLLASLGIFKMNISKILAEDA